MMSPLAPAARPADAGFTLIEALVAMAVLAVGAVSLLTAVETQAARISDLNDRTVARWVAENALVGLRLGLPPDDAPVRMMGVDWSVSSENAPTTDPDLTAITLRVGPADRTPRGSLVALSGYVATPAATAGAPQ